MAKKLGTSVKVPKVYFYLWEVLNFWPSINFNSIRHGESTSTASKQTYTASQLSKDLNKVPLLFKNLENTILIPINLVIAFPEKSNPYY